jgi:hypothetical protein
MRLDVGLKVSGFVVAHAGLAAQVAGLCLAFFGADPVAGERWLFWGFWLAGAGGAGVVYGALVDAGGSPKVPGGPLTYAPSAPRWIAALWAVGLTPLWGVLSLPIGAML